MVEINLRPRLLGYCLLNISKAWEEDGFAYAANDTKSLLTNHRDQLPILDEDKLGNQNVPLKDFGEANLEFENSSRRQGWPPAKRFRFIISEKEKGFKEKTIPEGNLIILSNRMVISKIINENYPTVALTVLATKLPTLTLKKTTNIPNYQKNSKQFGHFVENYLLKDRSDGNRCYRLFSIHLIEIKNACDDNKNSVYIVYDAEVDAIRLGHGTFTMVEIKSGKPRDPKILEHYRLQETLGQVNLVVRAHHDFSKTSLEYFETRFVKNHELADTEFDILKKLVKTLLDRGISSTNPNPLTENEEWVVDKTKTPVEVIETDWKPANCKKTKSKTKLPTHDAMKNGKHNYKR